MEANEIRKIARKLAIEYGSTTIPLRGHCDGKKEWVQKNELKIKAFYDGIIKVLDTLDDNKK